MAATDYRVPPQSLGARIPILILLLVTVILVAWAWQFGFLAVGNVIQSGLAKGNRGVLVLIASAGMVVGVNGITLLDTHEIKTNPIPAPRADMPNVILLSLDSLTAEDMSLYGYRLRTTPKLEAFAKESFVFENYFSSSNWTLPTVASFISGMYPITSGVHEFNSYFLEEDRKKNLGQVLQDNGYQTAAIVGNGEAHPLNLWISDSFSAVTEPPTRYLPISRFKLKNYRTGLWTKQTKIFSADLDLLDFFRTQTGASGDESYPYPAKLVFDRAIPFFLL